MSVCICDLPQLLKLKSLRGGLYSAGSGKFGASKTLASPAGPSAIVAETVDLHSNPSKGELTTLCVIECS